MRERSTLTRRLSSPDLDLGKKVYDATTTKKSTTIHKHARETLKTISQAHAAVCPRLRISRTIPGHCDLRYNRRCGALSNGPHRGHIKNITRRSKTLYVYSLPYVICLLKFPSNYTMFHTAHVQCDAQKRKPHPPSQDLRTTTMWPPP